MLRLMCLFRDCLYRNCLPHSGQLNGFLTVLHPLPLPIPDSVALLPLQPESVSDRGSCQSSSSLNSVSGVSKPSAPLFGLGARGFLTSSSRPQSSPSVSFLIHLKLLVGRSTSLESVWL